MFAFRDASLIRGRMLCPALPVVYDRTIAIRSASCDSHFWIERLKLSWSTMLQQEHNGLAGRNRATSRAGGSLRRQQMAQRKPPAAQTTGRQKSPAIERSISVEK